MKHQKYKNKQLKNNTFELENDFKPINIFINNMGKFEKKELTKKRTFTKNTWYDWHNWLMNYIPEPIEKPEGGVKDQIMSLSKTNEYSQPKRVKNVYGGRKKPKKLKIQN